MTYYIYFVKCPDCEDEHFDFFDEAKGFAMGCLSKKPVITQTEVNRNDFGECTDSFDHGVIWSWEDEVKDTEKETADSPSLLTKDFLNTVDMDNDPEFADDDDDDFRLVNGLEEAVTSGISFRNSEDFAEFKKLCDEIGLITMGDVKNFMRENNADDSNILDKLRAYRAELGPDFKIKEDRKPVPEGMTIEQLVEEMEENEDEVECTWCNDLFPKDQCRKEVNLGWLCSRCADGIMSRGETLTFKENNYWDFLDERLDADFTDDAASDSLDAASDVDEEDYFNQNFDEAADPFDHHDPDYSDEAAADALADSIDAAKDKMYDDSLDALEEPLPNSKIVTEGFDSSKVVEFEYDDLTITVNGTRRDADDWDEWEHTGSYTYKRDQGDVATDIWENFLTEEDVKDVEGGKDALEDNDAWFEFLDTHFDSLLDKYYDKLLDYYRDRATDEYQDNYEED